MRDISFVNDIDWTKKLYSLVTKRNQYNRPYYSLDKVSANNIYLTNFLQGTFWAVNDVLMNDRECDTVGIVGYYYIPSY